MIRGKSPGQRSLTPAWSDGKRARSWGDRRSRLADLRPVALYGYWLLLTCGCGVEFRRWVLPKQADDALAPLGGAVAIP